MLSLQAQPNLLPSMEPRSYVFNPLEDRRWNALIASSPHASIYHRREWLQALQETYGCEPRALTFDEPGYPLTHAFLFCEVRSWLTGDRLVSVPFSDHCDALATDPTVIDALLHAVSRVAGEGAWRYFEVRPMHYVPPFELGFGTCGDYVLHRIDLARSERALFQSFHKSCVQRRIRKAEREGLSYEQGQSETLLREFYSLLVMTRKRLGLPPQPLSWFRSLVRNFGKDLQIRVVRTGRRPIASIMTLCHRSAMVYKYGCSDERFSNSGATTLLLWNAMREAQEVGMSEFDLGRSDWHQSGLINFKDRWGAEKTILTYWRYPAPRTAAVPVIFAPSLRKLARVSPKVALRAAGKLLYRHIA
jgi:CelD/BcsL family acetyltransferase involved in cellulose biosynthesis